MSEHIKVTIQRWSNQQGKLLSRYYEIPYKTEYLEDSAKDKTKELEQYIFNLGGKIK